MQKDNTTQTTEPLTEEHLNDILLELNELSSTVIEFENERNSKKPYMQHGEVLNQLNINDDELYILVLKGKIRFVHYRNEYLYRQDDVLSLLQFDKANIEKIRYYDNQIG